MASWRTSHSASFSTANVYPKLDSFFRFGASRRAKVLAPQRPNRLHTRDGKQLQAPQPVAADTGLEVPAASKNARKRQKDGWGVFRKSDVGLLGLVARPPCRHKTGMFCCTIGVEISQMQCITLSACSLAIGVHLTGHAEARAGRATLAAIPHEQVRRHARETAAIDRGAFHASPARFSIRRGPAVYVLLRPVTATLLQAPFLTTCSVVLRLA